MGGYSFEDLEVYKSARVYRKKMYALARILPDIEKFVLCPQIRRAGISLTNGIAEGHGRFHYLDNIRFLHISRGSLEELIDDLNVCIDENYADIEYLEKLKTEGYELLHKINTYVAHLRRKKSESAYLINQQTPLHQAN